MFCPILPKKLTALKSNDRFFGDLFIPVLRILGEELFQAQRSQVTHRTWPKIGWLKCNWGGMKPSRSQREMRGTSSFLFFPICYVSNTFRTHSRLNKVLPMAQGHQYSPVESGPDPASA